MGLAGVEGGCDWTKSGRGEKMQRHAGFLASPYKKKPTLIERGGEISRRRFKVRDKLHKVKSHEGPGGRRDPWESLHAFLTGDRIDDCHREKKKMYTAEKADEL